MTVPQTMRRAGFAAAVLFSAAALLLTLPAHADKPSWAGGDKKTEKGSRHESKARFGDHARKTVYGHYDRDARAGRCPPGLARKHNGCMPPGQAKKWHVGQRLPRDVVFHDLPRQLVVDLGPPPSGYRYVRVAQDILMIAIGTGIVMDAINDIGVVLNR